jgi:isopentenyl-diphosphate delta-isomerase
MSAVTNTDIVDDELVDIVDGQGKVLGQALKSQAHKDGRLHLTTIGCLRYGRDIALVRQSSDRQDAGQLVSPVGGHAKAGETETQALLRETEEEIGTRNVTYKLLGHARFHRQVLGRNENHLFAVYEIRTDDAIMLGNEAESLERFSEAELKRALVDNPDEFGDALYFVLEYFYPEYLPEDYSYRWNK